MKLLVAIIFAFFIFSSAAKAPAPSIAQHVRVSYQEAISDDTYEVSYVGRSEDTKSQAMNKALYMAAQETLNGYYEWFRLVDMSAKETDHNLSYIVTLKYRMGAGYVESAENVYDARILKNLFE